MYYIFPNVPIHPSSLHAWTTAASRTRELHQCQRPQVRKCTWKIAKAWNPSQVLLWFMDLVECLTNSLYDQPYGCVLGTKISITQHQKPKELKIKSTEHTLYLNSLMTHYKLNTVSDFYQFCIWFFSSNNQTQGKQEYLPPHYKAVPKIIQQDKWAVVVI